MDKRPIGIFDSGLGGLTILKQLHQVLPHENLIYFGDTMNVPYGSKSKNTVTHFSLAIARFLQEQNAKLIVIACNTASALALPTLQRQLALPVLGVIEPGARQALQDSKNGRIAVLATEATVKSQAYPRALKRLNKQTRVFQQACPVLVPLIEEGWNHPAAAELIIEDYLKAIKSCQADTVILGCTHYPVIKKRIAKHLPQQVHLVDSAQVLAQEVKRFLTAHHQLKSSGKGQLKIYASDDPRRFGQLAKYILKKPLPVVRLKKLNV